MTDAKLDAQTNELIGQEDEFYVFPASYAQQRMFFLDELMPGNPIYNLPVAVRLQGDLQVPALTGALEEIVWRHESLRTRFTVEGREVQQIISPDAAFTLPVLDLTDLPASDREDRAFTLATEEARQPFDLAKGPLFRGSLLRLGDRDHVLLLTLHHIISDGWSTDVLIRELVVLYQAFAANADSPLPELDIQYADFSEWQREFMDSASMHKQLSYWKQKLGGHLPVLQLPTDRPRPAIQTHRGTFHYFTVPKALTDRLKDLSQREGVTLYMTLLAAYKTLLARYTGQTDIIVGSPIAGRNRGEIEPLIGLFVNTLALRTDLSGTTFLDLLRRVRQTTVEAFEHQDVPFEKLVAELQPERNMSFPPLFQVMFVLQNTPMREITLPGLTMNLMEADSETAKFDLTLTMSEGAEGLSGRMEYNTDLFDAATITRMGEHMQTLLESIVNNPQEEITRLNLLPEKECLQLIAWAERNEGSADEPTATPCIHHRFEQTAARFPNRIAATYEQDTLTYRELNERANRLAHHLQKKGVSQESLVGICLDRSLDTVISILGVLKAGGAYVPLDPTYPEERIAFVLQDAAVDALITAERYLTKAPSDVKAIVCPDRDAEEIAKESAANPQLDVRADNLAYVIYTSGSTGKPKGVLIPHRNVIRLFTQTEDWYGFHEHDVWTLFHSYAFDFSVWEIWGALFYGGKLVVVPYLTSRSPESFYQLLVQEKVTVLNQTPSAFRQLIAAEEMLGASPELALRYVIFGGEALELQSLTPWFNRHGDAKPRLINMYGITETTVHVTYREITQQDVAEGKGSVIGVPIPDLQVYVLDPHLRPAPIGVVGEMYVGGAGLARGYLNRPELTDERFIRNPLPGASSPKLYKTGDLARYLADGELEYQGRIDHQVKVRGFRIELGEIESTLVKLPIIREAVVLVREDTPGDKRLVGYLVPEHGHDLQTADVVQALKGELPDYMVPAAFVVLDTLPLTPNGKVDHRALPAPDPSAAGLQREYAAPRNDTERIMADIWAGVLKLERVGIDDKFFECGGDSILSIQVLAEARKHGLNFTLQDLFRLQTLRELAPHIDTGATPQAEQPALAPFALITDEDRARLPEDAEDAYPLVKLQEGMIFHNLLHPESAVYHNVNAYDLRGRFDRQAMEQALALLSRRHPSLRTSYHVDGYSEPLQVVHKQITLPLHVHDLRGQTEAEQKQALHTWMEFEKKNHFTLTEAPALRFHAHQLADDRFQFAFTEHHVALDGWSVATMLAELFGLYASYLEKGEVSPEPASADTFRDFVQMERETRNSVAAQTYWRNALDGHTVTKIPRLEAPRREQAEDAATESVITTKKVPVRPEVSQGLKRLADQAGAPIKTVLLAAHLRALSFLSGQTDVVSGLVTNGRPEELGGEKALGLFLNTLPFRLQLDGGTWEDLVKQTFQAEQDLMQHRRYPLAQIQQDHGGEALYEATFNYTHFHVFQTIGDTLEVLGETGYGITNFDFGVDFRLDLETADVLLDINANRHEFSDEHIARIADSYANTLEAMALHPQARYDQTTLLTAQEQQQLAAWNDTAQTFPGPALLHQHFEAQAARTPDAAAVLFGDTALTYRELNERANRIARRLIALNGPGEHIVGLLMERSAEMVIGMLGILKAGQAYLPLDPTLPSDRLTFMIENAEANVLLTTAQFVDLLPGVQSHLLVVDQATLFEAEADNPNLDLPAERLAYVIYTSGSTGQPKGVMIPHRAIVNHMNWMQAAYPLTAQDRILQKTPFGFDASVWEFHAPLMAGAQLVMAEPEGHKDSAYLARAVHDQGITRLQLVPSMLQAMLEEPSLADCTDLRHVFCGGEALPPEAVKRFYERLPHAELHNLYGPTEACIDATSWDCAHEVGSRSIPIGHPVANTELHVLDPHGQPVPVGTPGELHIGGAGLARGYLNRPDLTDKAFIRHPFRTDEYARLYKTGDLVRRLPDGSLDYLGRRDHQVKLRGFRIELGEIEEVLSRHADVREAVVIALEDTTGDKRLAAYVVPADGAAQTAVQELRAHLQQELPPYMVPSFFLLLDALPLTPNGKIDRKALPAPERDGAAQEREFVAPRTQTEEKVAHLYADVLNLKQVGATDHFFEIGGHSLMATRLISRVRQTFQVELPLRSLFEAPTVAALAELLDRIQAGEEQAGDLQESGGRARESQAISRHPFAIQAPPLTPASRDEHLPLSFAQERLWFLEQFASGTATYNIPLALRLNGTLHQAALARSLREIVARHEILRTRYHETAGRPHQVIEAEADFDLHMADLGGLDAAERETAARNLINEESQRPFDLTSDLPLRAVLIRLAEHEHMLLLTMHHIASDGWSVGVLFQELSALYTAFAEGALPALPKLPVQYADYAAWQRDWLQGDVLDAQLAYWQQKLGASLPVLQLPTDRPRPAVQTTNGATLTAPLSGELATKLRDLSRQTDSTLFMTLLSAFNVLLYRFTGQDDLVVGTPIAGRTQGELEPLIGFFVNTLALRSQLAGNMSFRDLLRQVREETLNAYANQDVPFEKLVEVLQPVRDLSYSPLFQVMFALQNAPLVDAAWPDLTVEPLAADVTTAKFDLTLTMVETEAGLTATMEYNTDLFHADTIERLMHHFTLLLDGIAAHPEQAISELPLLPDAEKATLLHGLNRHDREFPAEPLHRLFEQQAAKTPDLPAVSFGDQHWTYRDLNERANRLARKLLQLDPAQDQIVGLYMERSMEMVLGMLAALKAGKAYLPLDPSLPEDRLAFMIEDASVTILLTQSKLRGQTPVRTAHLLCLDEQDNGVKGEVATGLTADGMIHSTDATDAFANLNLPIHGDQLAYVIYTSGSTGKPKGVMIPHRAIVNHMCWMQETYPLTEQDRVLQKTPFGFDGSVWEFYAPLLAGAQLVIAEPGGHQDSAYLVQAVQTHGITRLQLVPTMLHAMLDEPNIAACTTLRHVFCGGEALSVELVTRFHERLNAVRLTNLYGPTEACIDATAWDCDPHQTGRTIPIGRPIANTKAYLLDEHGQPVPIGVPGELHLAGAGLARGYLNREDLTAQAFLRDPFADDPEARMYKTGDLARYLPDGSIEYLGRLDHQVKVRGYRIELGEIETLLLRHPQVNEAVVIAREDAPGNQRLVAYFTAAEGNRPTTDNAATDDTRPTAGNTAAQGTRPTADDLRQALRADLPDYMIPSAFVLLDEMPLLINGKVDRKALPAPDTASEQTAAYLAPRDKTELLLTRLFAEVLGLERVGVRDDFFALGGHSLLAVRLKARLRESFGRDIPLPVLFQQGTVERLAAVLRTEKGTVADTSAVQLKSGSKTPLFLVHPVGGTTVPYQELAARLDPEQPLYGLEACGLEEGQTPHTRIEDMAARYLADIRAVQPEGPYLLGGWSLGGTVAYEMARQLQAQGEQVALLLLLDSVAPIPANRDAAFREEQALTHFAQEVAYRLNLSLDHLDDALRELDTEAVLQDLLDQAVTAGALPADARVEQLERLYRVYAANMRAVHDYAPAQLRQRTVLFRAEDETEGAHQHPTTGWSDLLTDGLHVELTPGDHNTILQPPHVQSLADRLNHLLQQHAEPDKPTVATLQN